MADQPGDERTEPGDVTPEGKRPLSRRLRVLVVAVITLLVLSLTAVALADKFVVKAKGTRNKWRPVHTYITKGDVVVWKNLSVRGHDVTAYGGKWTYYRWLDPGDRARKRFRKAGTYRYRCKIHSGIVDGRCKGMCGWVHVFNP